MTTIETKIARAKELGKTSISLWTDEDITDAAILLPDLASECERLQREAKGLRTDIVGFKAELTRIRALVKSAPHEEDCPNDYVISTEGRVHRCTCWKQNLNQPTP